MGGKRTAVAYFAAVPLLAWLSAVPASAAADLSRYVAMGDGLTAGFSNGGLHIDGQLAGYARLLSEQARGVGARFEQPLMTDPGIPAITRLESRPGLRLAPNPGLGSPINLTLSRPYDNLAVPGAKVGDLLRTTSDSGGLHDLILRSIGTQLEQALLVQPTFVSLWIGPTDALGAATSGIVLDGVTLTPLAEFEADYNEIVQTLVAGGVGAGVVATVPRVTAIPFVTTIPPVVVSPTNGEAVLVDGAPVPLLGPGGPLGTGDFVLLTASPLLARGDGVPAALGGSGVALPDNVILDAAEARQVDSRAGEYNDVIRQAAADVGFAVVEMGALLEEVDRDGLLFGGASLTTDFLTGGLFSLDGVHPSPIGCAFAANAFIEAVNRTYGNQIPAVNLAALAFGDRGRLPGSGPAAALESTSRFVYTKQAYKNLRFGLGVPRAKKLLRLKKKAQRRWQKKRFRGRTFELPPTPELAGWVGTGLAGAALPVAI